MSWNKPHSGEMSRPLHRRGKGCITNIVILLGFIFVIGTVVCAWFVSINGNDGNANSFVKKAKSQIEEVKPARANVSTNAIAHEGERPKIPTYRDERGVLRYQGGARVPDPTRPTRLISPYRNPDGTPKFKTLFKNRAENELAALLSMEPGDTRIGSMPYNKAFEQAFANALFNPIEIQETDTEADIQMRKDVDALKKELAERIRNGENLKDMLETYVSENNRLGAVKHDLQQMLNEEISKDELSDDDLGDMFTAANKMLADKGLKPLSRATFTRKLKQMKMKKVSK